MLLVRDSEVKNLTNDEKLTLNLYGHTGQNCVIFNVGIFQTS